MQLNTEWARSRLKQNDEASGKKSSGNDDIKFVFLPKDAGALKFRVMPPDNKGRLGIFVYYHYNVPHTDDKGNVQYGRRICVRHTFPESELPCPICDAIEHLVKCGVKEDELRDSVGHAAKSYVKVTLPDGKDQDGNAVPVTQACVLGFSNSYSLEWIIEKLMDPDNGNFTDVSRGNNLKFSREKKGTKWERSILPGSSIVGGTEEAAQQALQSSEAIDLYAMWKIPGTEEAEAITISAELLKRLELSKIGNNPVPTGNSEPEARIPAAPQPTRSADALQEENKKQLEEFRPAGAPICFADAGAYNDDSPKCIACAFQLDCSDKIVAAAKEVKGNGVALDDDTPF